MDKTELRDSLFQKYFEVKEGIPAIDLVGELSFIPYFWKLLNDLCQKNLEYFDSFDTLDMIKAIEHNGKSYLILKIDLAKYTIIDLENMTNITKEGFVRDFNEDFFINNFDEIPMGEKIPFAEWYSLEYFKNPAILVDYYNFNDAILTLSTSLYYIIEIDEVCTYFSIDFANGSAQLGFETPDKFLYEQLFLNFDLTAASMQDAVSKIGEERIVEMFDKIKEIKIPTEVIPEDLLKIYMSQTTVGNNKGIKLEQPTEQ